MKNDAAVPFCCHATVVSIGGEGNQLLRILKQSESLPGDPESPCFTTLLLAIPGQTEPAPLVAWLSQSQGVNLLGLRH